MASRNALQGKATSLETINTIADAIHRSLDFQTVAERAVDAIAALTPFTGVSIFSLDADKSTFELVCSKGFSKQLVQQSPRLPVEGSLMGLAIERRGVVTADDLTQETRGLPDMREALIQEGFRKIFSVPLIHQDEPLGTMNLVLRGEQSLTEEEQGTVLSIGSTIAMAMANASHVGRIKSAEEKLRTIVKRYDLATAAAKVGVWEWNLETGDFYLDSNVKAILGYSDSEIPNDLDVWVRYVHPDDKEAVSAAIDKHLKGRTPEFVCEHRMLHRDGSIRWILARGKAVHDSDGKTVRMLGTDAEITERKRLEEERRALERQIIHAEKLKSLGVLAGGIAHDFNNLLTSVLGNAELALARATEESGTRRALERIDAAARQAADLTRQLLAYSGRGAFVFRPVSVSRLVREMTGLLRLSISKKAVLKSALTDDLPAVDGDPTQLRQVIMNLITNASEALEGGSGTITLETGVTGAQKDDLRDLSGRCVYLSVSDTGMGMDESVRSKIFDPFYTTKLSGRGLGLAVVLGIVRGHNGAIEVTSDPGRGTTIRVVLPASPDPESVFDETRLAPSEDMGGGTVLVVDDEEGVRSLATEILEEAGFVVEAATNGREAVEVFRRRPEEIRLVVLDMTMPKMSGQEALRAIRAIRPDVRVILSSGYRDSDVLRGEEMGELTGFLEKPYGPSGLIDAVRRALR